MMATNNKNKGLLFDINVTPFVDVMLVLLVIFMVTAPMMMQGIDVKVPNVQAPAIDSPEERLIITVTADKKVLVNEYEIAAEDLTSKLEALYANKGSRGGVFLRADEGLPYGFVMEVMGRIKQAGIEEIGMVTEGSGLPKQVEKKK